MSTAAPRASRESAVRYYGRQFPATFVSASGSLLRDDGGRTFVDLFAAAGALNYGHNPPELKAAIRAVLDQDAPLATLDFGSAIRDRFIATFSSMVLEPRGMEHRIQFCGPTGANAVEAALRLARKNRQTPFVGFLSGAYHGMSLGALGVSDRADLTLGSPVPTRFSVRLGHPADGDTLESLASALSAAERETPLAAIILETVQGDGGARALPVDWMRALASYCSRTGTLLIVDDIQAGCGRTGTFFSFDRVPGFEPDIVCLSKSLSGCGLPLSVCLVRPRFDVWRPGEHTGTFRGNTMAMATATRALELYWEEPGAMEAAVAAREDLIRTRLEAARRALPDFRITGRGLLLGIQFDDVAVARQLSSALFGAGVIAETCGADDRTLKLIPALNIGMDTLDAALSTLTRLLQRIEATCPAM
jgi:diaminobutyrate-2-oxoglutarate transaminase